MGRRNAVPYLRPVGGGGATAFDPSKCTCFYVVSKCLQGRTRRNGRRGVLCRKIRGVGGGSGRNRGPYGPAILYLDPHVLQGGRGHHSRTERAVVGRTGATAAEGGSFLRVSNVSCFTCSRGPPRARKTRHKTRVYVERLRSGFRSRKRSSLCSLLASVPT